MKTQDLSVRNIPAQALKGIDERACKKNISRSEYVRQLICTHTIQDELKNTKEKYDEMVQRLILALEQNTITLEKVNYLLENINSNSNITE